MSLLDKRHTLLFLGAVLAGLALGQIELPVLALLAQLLERVSRQAVVLNGAVRIPRLKG